MVHLELTTHNSHSALFCTTTALSKSRNHAFPGLFGLSSVVGYSGSALDTEFGAVMTGPQFLAVGGSALSITNINIVSVADTAGSVAIQTLNNFGGTGDEDYTWDGTKWTDTNTGADVSDVTFAPGKGLWVYNFTGEAVSFQSAGEVSEIDVNYPLDTEYGAVAIVNPFPTSVALADITLTSDPGVDLSASIVIQTLNNYGGTGDEDYTWDGTKWTDTNTGAAVSNVTIAPGKGLWVYNFTGEPVGFHIPAPEL